jgi:hypothetical protein
MYKTITAGPSGCAVKGVGLRLLVCCDRGFESHRGMDVCLLCVVRGLRWADHSSRGVLPTVARRCVWSRNLVDEEAIARAGLQSQRKEYYYYYYYYYYY